MKHRTGNIYVTLAVAGVLFAHSAVSQDKPATADTKAKAASPDREEMMKKAEAAATPGPAHKALEPLGGDWNVDGRCFTIPDAPSSEMKGDCKVRWILGGRFVQEDFNAEFMGRPFQGISVTGYDNLKKKYVSSWVDDMSTALFISEGSADVESKVFTFQGTMDDPMTGKKNKPVKYIIRILGPDKHTFEMHDLTLGDKSKTMEMIYTRK